VLLGVLWGFVHLPLFILVANYDNAASGVFAPETAAAVRCLTTVYAALVLVIVAATHGRLGHPAEVPVDARSPGGAS
jgi:hypothetical protein